MTLLDDLRALDTSGIVSARAGINVSVQGGDLQSLLGGSVSATALGPLGGAINSLDDPAKLLQPLLDGIAGIAAKLDFGQLPIGALTTAVTAAGGTVSALLDGIDERPESWLRLIGLSSEALERGIGGGAADLAARLDADIGPLRGVFEIVDGGLPTDPEALAKLVIEFVLPFPAATLGQLRGVVDRIALDLDGLAMPGQRLAGLAIELDAVTAAAEAGRLAEVDARLRAASNAATIGIASLRADLAKLRSQVGALDIAGRFDPLAPALGAFRTGRHELLGLLAELQGYMRAGRLAMEALTPETFNEALDQAEGYVNAFVDGARARLEALVDAKIAEIAEWLRGLFAHLGLRALRAEISAGLQAIVDKIRELDPTPLLDAIRKPLIQLRDLIAGVDLGDRIQAALADARAVMDAALTPIIAALDAIKAVVDALAGQASATLGQAVEVVEGFGAAIESAKSAIEGLGVTEARERVVATVIEIREAAEAVLSTLPLPEPLRPAVEHLIAELEKLDRATLEAQILTPVRAAAAQIKLPPEVAEQVTAALAEIGRVIENLLPQALVDGIAADVKSVLDRVRGFDPASLVGEVDGFIAAAASRVEALDLSAPLDAAGGVVDQLLAKIDDARPGRLLQPVIEAYDRALGALPLPEPDAAAEQSFGFMERQAEALGQALVAPVASLTGASAAPRGAVVAALPIDPATVRPGDALRIFTHIPTKLREAIAALGAGPAGAMLAVIERSTSGLARDLRAIEDRLAAVETRLNDELAAIVRGVQAAEFRARFAVEARLELGPADLAARLDLMAAADPTALRIELAAAVGEVRALLGEVFGGPRGGGVLGMIETIAGALEACRLSRLSGSLDELLAALDPEPLAAELDALAQAALGKVALLGFAVEGRVAALLAKIEAAFRDLDPMMLARRFLRLVTVVREELDILNPATLAAELDGIHAALRANVAALDPRQLKVELRALTAEIAAQLRGVNVGALLGDLNPFGPVIARLEAADPSKALAGIGAELAALTPRLQALDPAGLIEAVNGLPDKVVDEFAAAANAIIEEVLALLAALKFASGSASVSVTASAG